MFGGARQFQAHGADSHQPPDPNSTSFAIPLATIHWSDGRIWLPRTIATGTEMPSNTPTPRRIDPIVRMFSPADLTGVPLSCIGRSGPGEVAHPIRPGVWYRAAGWVVSRHAGRGSAPDAEPSCAFSAGLRGVGARALHRARAAWRSRRVVHHACAAHAFRGRVFALRLGASRHDDWSRRRAVALASRLRTAGGSIRDAPSCAGGHCVDGRGRARPRRRSLWRLACLQTSGRRRIQVGARGGRRMLISGDDRLRAGSRAPLLHACRLTDRIDPIGQ